jgi:hypothetical protein
LRLTGSFSIVSFDQSLDEAGNLGRAIMSSYANIAETTAIQSFHQGGGLRRHSWLQAWLEARRTKAAQHRLADKLSSMDSQQQLDIGIDPAGLAATTIRLAELNPAVVSCSFMFSLSRG